MTTAAALQRAEVEKFEALAHEFWDERGAFRPLHALNPVRLQYVAERAPLSGQRVLDVGCGGGLLTEALARRGAEVHGLDLAPSMIEVARLHAADSGLEIDYQLGSAEQLAERAPGSFDVITCMELIEHVADPGACLGALARLLKPDGQLFLSSINRTLRSFLLAIVAAEYVLKLIPRGTHAYAQLLRPSEVAALARAHGLGLRDVSGLAFNPLSGEARLTRDPGVNYLMHCARTA